MSDSPATAVRSSRLLICERTGKWAVALRRELGGDARWIVETRALSQLSEALAEHPASLAAIELAAGAPCSRQRLEAAAAEFAGELLQLRDQFPAAGFVILAKEVSADAQWLLREAGAAHIAVSRRRLAPVARIWQRHRRRHPPAESGVKEILWERLPWS
jgi:hypothetical protein